MNNVANKPEHLMQKIPKLYEARLDNTLPPGRYHTLTSHTGELRMYVDSEVT